MRPPVSAVGPCLGWWQAELDRVMRKVCKSSLQLDVKMGALGGRQASAPEALDEMPQVSLPFLLGTSGSGAALFVLDGILIDGLIEQQLLGEILPTERLDRPVTSIDAGLSQSFVRAALDAITAEASGQLAGLQVDRTEQDRANLRLALGEGRYDILQAEIDMGPGIKTGRFELWVPALAENKGRRSKARINTDMLQMLQSCEVELRTKLEGCEASAHDLMNLDVGTLLSVPRTALTRVELSDGNNQPFAQGRLGQLNGARAVLLTKVYGKAAPQEPPVLAKPPPSPIPLSEPDASSAPAADGFEEGVEVTTASSDKVGSAA